MKKKVIAVLIGLTLCCVLAGCGGNNEAAEETVEVVEEEAEAEDETDVEDDVAEEEVEEGEWVYDEENELWIWNEYDENGEAVDSGLTIRVLTEDEIESESEVVSDEAVETNEAEFADDEVVIEKTNE